MFHQVFILDTPEEEQDPNISQQIDEDMTLTGQSYCEIEIKNGQTEFEKKVEKDVQKDTSEQQLGKSLKLDPESEIASEENKALSEINLSLLTKDNEEIKNNQIALVKKMEVDSQNDILNHLGKSLTLDVKSEIDPEENKEELKMNLGLMITQDNEALNKTTEVASNEQSGNLTKKCCTNKKLAFSSPISNNNNNRKSNDFNNEKICLAKNIKGEEINNLLGDIQILDSKKDQIHIDFTTFIDENPQCKKDKLLETISVFYSRNKNLSDTQIPSDVCTENNCDEIIEDNNLGNICNINKLPTRSLIKTSSERRSLSSEENSGSDWEEEYFVSTGVDLKKTVSKDLCEQNDNTTSLEYSNLIKYLAKENVPEKIYPEQPSSEVINTLPDSKIFLSNKFITSLNKRKESCGNIVFSIGNINNDNIIKTSNSSNELNESVLYEYDEKVNNYEKKQNVTPHQCCDCKKYFSDKYCLKKHIKRKHPERALINQKKIEEKKIEEEKKMQTKSLKANESELFICDVCHNTFETRNQMTNHTRTLCFGYRRDLKCQCDVCGKCFTSESKLQAHKNTHTNAKPFKCSECDKCFNSTTTRHMHYKKTHQNISKTKHLCSYCGITSDSISHLLAHEETHRLPEGAEIPLPFKCFCGRGYVSKYKLNSHMREHKMKKCLHCSELFKTRSLLRLHLKDIHSIVKHFKCKICEKFFECRLRLRSHMQIHSALKYFCNICDKGFKIKRHVTQHMITHSDERPLSCPDCGDRFKRKTHLNQHISATHRKRKRTSSNS